SLHNLATVLARRGKFEEAETTYRESIELSINAHGTREHRGVVVSLGMLAQLLLSRGRAKDALTQSREAWDAAVAGRLGVELVFIGPVHIECLQQNQIADEVGEV